MANDIHCERRCVKRLVVEVRDDSGVGGAIYERRGSHVALLEALHVVLSDGRQVLGHVVRVVLETKTRHDVISDVRQTGTQLRL